VLSREHDPRESRLGDKTSTVRSRDARFQQWQALLANRRKRQQAGEFLVQGVRPITLAVQHGWPLRALIYDADRSLSSWARETIQKAQAAPVAMATELITELGEKPDDPPELVAVAAIPADDLDRITVADDFLGLAFDRPTSPGNIGTLIRSADAFGASGLIVTGHAADPYDPKSVRASTGSLFAVPVVRTASATDVLTWANSQHVAMVGTDENGTADIADYDLTRPALLVIGNETTGLSAAWRDACDAMVRIPITGSASSLNAANAGTIALYEAARQRHGAGACLDANSLGSIRSRLWDSPSRSRWRIWKRIRILPMPGCAGKRRSASFRRSACGSSPGTRTLSRW
jgi:23S rRNA (uridine2479-2'-O)-methyltransferase